MRRRRVWSDTLIVVFLFLATVYCAATLLLTEWVLECLRDVGGNSITVRRVTFQPPFQLALIDAHLFHVEVGAEAWFACHRVIAEPFGISWPRRLVRLRRLQLNEPAVQLVRTKEGSLLVPGMSQSFSQPSSPPTAEPEGLRRAVENWRLVLATLEVNDGQLTFIDQKLDPPFRLTLTDLRIVAGPLRLPLRFDTGSVAIQGRLMGANDQAAPIYCSGWSDLPAGNLDFACQLESLRLTAFEPYYQGTLRSGLYNATLRATLHFTATDNELDGRIQVSMENLSDADLAMLRTTLMTVKRLTGGSERLLTGEIQVSGPLNQPSQWRIQLIPGNDIMQRLVTPLLNRGVEFVRLKLAEGQVISIGLQPATEALMLSIRTASRDVEENLRIVAPNPFPNPPPALAPLVPAEPTPEPPPAGVTTPASSPPNSTDSPSAAPAS